MSSLSSNNNNNLNVTLTDLSNLLDQLHSNLLNLQTLCIKYPKIPIISTNNTIINNKIQQQLQFPPELLTPLLNTISTLLTVTIPSNLYMLQLYQNYYSQKLQKIQNLSLIILCVYAATVFIIVVIGIAIGWKIWREYLKNC